MEKSKVKKTVKRPIKLSEINKLSMCVFIVNREYENQIKTRLHDLQARVVSIIRGIGVSRYSMFSSLKVGTSDMVVILAISRVEDTKKVMKTISIEFSLAKPGNGKSFVIDVDGYLGAKAKFIGDWYEHFW